MNPLNLQNMKKLLLSLITCCVVSLASAIDVASTVKTLGGDDYAARLQARLDLKKAFAGATAPGAVAADDLALEASVIAQLSAEGLPLTGRLYLIRMLELFGTDTGADAAYALLGDSEKKVRESARRALVAIPGAKAEAYLIAALSNGPEADRAAYIDALATRGAGDAAPVIAELLQSSDPALVAASALALGKLGNDAVIPALLSARQSASGETKALIESALLQIGVDADTAYSLAGTSSRGVIRAEAFKQLVASDPKRAKQVLEVVLAEPGFSGRLLFIQAALASDSAPLLEAVVAHLSGASVNDQVVIVTAIGEQGLAAYEAQLLALLPKSEGILHARIIHALGNVGGDASFEPLYQAFSANTKDKNAANALARVQAPAADQKALASVEHGSDTAARIASLKVLELRNTSGAVALLNGIISGPADAKLKEAAFKSLESIGNDDSIRILLKMVTAGDAQSKAAQRSLKRLSMNFGAPEYQWDELYHPVLESAASDAARQAVIQILDGVACQPVIAYLQDLLLDSDLSMRPVAMSALQRWPLQEQLYEGDLWLSIASAESSSDKDRSQAARALKKCLTYSSHRFYAAQGELLVKIVQAELPLEYKRDLLNVYEDPAKHFSVSWKRRPVIQSLKTVENDPEVGDLVRQITSKL
ncbi:MAG: HEAT repeat protein [Yoonia sp.]|jgi:HEAT repeat protein